METYICDPAVEQRIAEIEGWIWHRDAMHRLDPLCGRNYSIFRRRGNPLRREPVRVQVLPPGPLSLP
jgi:hypothetical protein